MKEENANVEKKEEKPIKIINKKRLGLPSIVFLILLVFKLLGLSDISWFWVFSPLIAWLVIGLIIFGIYIILLILKELFK